jgi:polyhydroxybutyrate depolymerase
VCLVHVPPTEPPKEGFPVVIVFHGGGGRPESQKKWAALDPVADSEGFVTVYPDGSGALGRRLLTWNAGTCCGYAEKNHVDDVGFVFAALGDLNSRLPVDQTRVYATGISNGAMMSYRLAVEASDRIAAIAPIAGGLVVDGEPSRPVPVMHFHGVDDPRAPYRGGLGPPFPFTNVRVTHPKIDDVIAKRVSWDGCTGDEQVGPTLHGSAANGDATHTATKHTWTSCKDGSEVVLWKLTGAGHVWPGSAKVLPESILGPPTRVIDASREIWTFFKRFRRLDAPRLDSARWSKWRDDVDRAFKTTSNGVDWQEEQVDGPGKSKRKIPEEDTPPISR